MDLNLGGITVTNNEEAQCFETSVDGPRAFIAYRRFPDRIVFTHSEVPPPLEGKGLASKPSKLAHTALGFARVNHLRVVPLCPYVSGFIRRHSEYRVLVSPGDLQRVLSP